MPKRNYEEKSMGAIRNIPGSRAVARYVRVLKMLPVTDQARIAEVRNNIEIGKYFSEDIAYKTAEKMLGLVDDLDV
jgi:hypothetical protein